MVEKRITLEYTASMYSVVIAGGAPLQWRAPSEDYSGSMPASFIISR
jgi:hypothetical protein